ncbi:hypothetical protein VTN49DRAFT_7247 [Thermomyces lanuginosus]|uniref:uncharacterized protein n=1 Tax=Thermomyces lanuginosus TaxID=5541 RepID=UPI003744A8EC
MDSVRAERDGPFGSGQVVELLLLLDRVIASYYEEDQLCCDHWRPQPNKMTTTKKKGSSPATPDLAPLPEAPLGGVASVAGGGVQK